MLLANLSENITASANQVFKTVAVMPYDDFATRIDDGLTLYFVFLTHGRIVMRCAVAKDPHVRVVEKIRLDVNARERLLSGVRQTQTLRVEMVEKLPFGRRSR